MLTCEQLRPYLRQCGYTDCDLRQDFAYTDAWQARSVPLAAFAYGTCNAWNACIAASDFNSCPSDNIQEQVAKFRGLGAPILFACRQNLLEWWKFTLNGPRLIETHLADKLPNFFGKHKKDFSPDSIYRAKTLGTIRSEYQLQFVDKGLMPVLEERMGEEIARVMNNLLAALRQEFASQTMTRHLGQWMFQSAFWLLGAKVLKDKEVPGFKKLDLEDIDAVLQKVRQHYGAQQPPDAKNLKQKTGLKAAAHIISQFSSLANLTVESLGYVYENTLISKDVRKTLGIHATPSYLVDYIVWQLAPWIEQIPEDKRYVLEPTCGHAPFLISAARLLRELYPESDTRKRHDYLKNHLVGVEVDPFAREIARLSLTLADVPNPNGWKLQSADVYHSDILARLAKKSTILLCNPPFENFTPAEQRAYRDHGSELRSYNKAAEMLWRILPNLKGGSAIGVILPRGFMHRKDIRDLRKLLAADFELQEICELPDNVFTRARHESVVLIGRKKSAIRSVEHKTKIVRVRRWDLEQFRRSYAAPSETVLQARLQREPHFEFLVPQLEAVWDICKSYPKLCQIADVGKGLEYYPIDELPQGTKTIQDHEFPGSVRGYASFDEGIGLTDTPKIAYLSLASSVIRRPGKGVQTGIPQVLVNYAPVSLEPWRLKALIDRTGYPATSRFIVVRPFKENWSLAVIWAILNSPFANAYLFTRGTKRDVLVRWIKEIPLPDCTCETLKRLDHLTSDYLELFLSQKNHSHGKVDYVQAMTRLLAVDAEVLRLYDLPPQLERQLLDLFAGHGRKGVPFEFTRYFPEDFESWIPLHEYLSKEYQRSTVSLVNQWVENTKSPDMTKAFEAAGDAFRED